MHARPTRIYSWLVVGLLGAAVGCGASSSGSTGGAGSGGTPAGGKSGGGSGGQNSGGNAGSGGSGGVEGSAQGGTTGSGGFGSGGSAGTGGGFGGQASGGAASGGTASGGRASGGSGGSGGASGSGGGQGGSTTGASGLGSGGVPATGGQGTGGQGKGGGSGAGGAGTGGSGAGQGGRATGGTSGSGGVSGTGGGTGYRPCPTDGTACKIMPFGDSITDGYNADTPGGYRVELFRRAHSAGKNVTFVGSGSNGPTTVDGVAFPRNHEGHSGWTIDPEGSRSGISTLLKNDGGSQSVMVKFTPHIVLLMIGTNDAIDNYDMANAPTRLGKLIDTIYSQLPNVLIVVAQLIPGRDDASKGDDTGLSARIRTYNDAIPGVVKTRADAGKHILVVDMYTPFTPKSSLLEDQWHPNLQGYVVLGTQWYSVLQPLL